MQKFFTTLKEKIIYIDIELLRFINIKLYNKYLAEFIKIISNDIFLISLLFLVFFIFFKIKKIDNNDKLNLALALWGIIILNILNTSILKPFFKRPRPSAVFPDIYLLANLKKLGYAFPSTHSLMAMFLVTILWQDYKVLRPFLLFFIISVAFFCVYTGGHYPLDVVAGIILGWVCGLFILKLKKVVKK